MIDLNLNIRHDAIDSYMPKHHLILNFHNFNIVQFTTFFAGGIWLQTTQGVP